MHCNWSVFALYSCARHASSNPFFASMFFFNFWLNPKYPSGWRRRRWEVWGYKLLHRLRFHVSNAQTQDYPGKKRVHWTSSQGLAKILRLRFEDFKHSHQKTYTFLLNVPHLGKGLSRKGRQWSQWSICSDHTTSWQKGSFTLSFIYLL